MILPASFYQDDDVDGIAQALLGMELCTEIGGQLTSGLITETESYAGIIDKASHAYNNRRTPRTETMYLPGGCAYIYLCYGMHTLFNVVTSKKDNPHAVLIRAISPLQGLDLQLQRRKAKTLKKDLFVGPGKVCQALGITQDLQAKPLQKKPLWIQKPSTLAKGTISKAPRIGIDYAEEWAEKPMRFILSL